MLFLLVKTVEFTGSEKKAMQLCIICVVLAFVVKIIHDCNRDDNFYEQFDEESTPYDNRSLSHRTSYSMPSTGIMNLAANRNAIIS